MEKKYKIGRYWYQEIPTDEYGEAKTEGLDEKEIYVLIDWDGEPIKYFKRI